MPEKSKMLLQKTFQETKIFFHKTSHNLKLCLSSGYRKLPIFSGRNNNTQKFTDSNNLYVDFSGQWKTTSNEIQNENNPENGDVEQSESFTKLKKQINVKIMKEEKKKEKSTKCREITKGELSSKRLAKKMKDLEMMDVNDVDHVLDVEEVLHYYSRLSSPVYVDIVDKFFVDMHNEYKAPQPILSANGSMRRSSSLRSNGSMRRLAPLKL